MSSSDFWDIYWRIFCFGAICFPLPIGFLWLWLYRNRRTIGLPDWLSGLLAQGIISGHKVDHGKAGEDDYMFIIIATVILVAIMACIITFLMTLSPVTASHLPTETPFPIITTKPQPTNTATSKPLPTRTLRPTRVATRLPVPASTRIPPAGNNQSSNPANITCNGAPATRLNVGFRARVTYTDGTPGSVRPAPASGQILGKVPEGVGMDIIGGPRCDNSRIWWRVETDNGYEGWISEGKPGEYWLEPTN